MEPIARVVAVVCVAVLVVACALSIWRSSRIGYVAVMALFLLAVGSLAVGWTIPIQQWHAVDVLGAFVLVGLVGYFITVHAVLGTKITEPISNAALKSKLIDRGAFRGIYKAIYLWPYFLFILLIGYAVLRLARGDLFVPAI